MPCSEYASSLKKCIAGKVTGWQWVDLYEAHLCLLLCVPAGIFVDDIIEAVPIDKYFELFKPNMLGGGGFIRIHMNFVKDLSELQQQPGAREGCVCEGTLVFGNCEGLMVKVISWP